MITEQDLQEAIAECLGQRNPNANTCIKLAAYYIIRENMFGKRESEDIAIPTMSFSSNTVDYEGESSFMKEIIGKDAEKAWMLVDELMIALQVVNPKLYASAMRKAAEI